MCVGSRRCARVDRTHTRGEMRTMWDPGKEGCFLVFRGGVKMAFFS